MSDPISGRPSAKNPWLRYFRTGAGSYALCLIMTTVLYFSGALRLPFNFFLALILAILAVKAGFFWMFRTGRSKAFTDPGLTFPRIGIALICLMVITYFTDEFRGVLLPLYLIVFSSGVFRLTTGQFLTLTLITIAGYALVVLLLLSFHPDQVYFRIELLRWATLVLVLPWFSFIGGSIGRLRNRVDQTNRKLEDSLLRHKELYDNMMDIVLLVDPDGSIVMANPLFCRMVGISYQRAVGASFIEFVHPEDRKQIESLLNQGAENGSGSLTFQFRLVDPDGNTAVVECNAKEMRKNDKLIARQMVIRDITQRKSLEDRLIRSYQNLKNARAATIVGLAKLAEYRDQSPAEHLDRVSEYSRLLAVELSRHPKYSHLINDDFIEDISLSAVLHDVGKVGVPDSILLFPGRLTPDEFETVKRHSILGGDALKEAEVQAKDMPFLRLGREISYHHHEKWDGSGYPMGLAGDDIPLSARIVAIADVYDVLTTRKAYKPAYTHVQSCKIILDEKGRHFDPDIVEVFLRNADRFREIRGRLRGPEDHFDEKAPFTSDDYATAHPVKDGASS